MLTSLRIRLKSWWGKTRDWSVAQWLAIKPGPLAKRGAWRGMLLPVLGSVTIAGLYLQSGFGYAFDFTLVILVAALLLPLVALGVALVLTLLRKLPRRTTGILAGGCTLITLAWGPPDLTVPLAILLTLANACLGAAIAALFSAEFSQAVWKRKLATLLLLVAGLAANTWFVWLLAHDGNLRKIVSWKPPAANLPEKSTAPNPNTIGAYPVKRLYYGAGTDQRRPEYGAGVALKTRTLDASEFFKDFKGWKRWIRKIYWGFDLDRLPLNARVWYPDGPGPFPLVLIVHGNHNLADFSDPGYAYLGELLASRGFIFASIDENFLNSGLYHELPKQQAVRGWMLLEHLRLWREWDQAAGNPFQGKVDLTRIALMGHSRGGEAAATAAAFNRLKYCPENAQIEFDYGFDIRAVVAIAPVDGQYKPAERHRWVENVSYLTLHGSHDADVSTFQGSRQWDHVRYTRPGPWFKAEIYAYRANHGQFNTVWGDSDQRKPLGWLLNKKQLMSGDDQRRIAKTYITAFLEATLRDRTDYRPLLRDWRTGRDWLPETIYLNRYQDASYIPLATYAEDADLTTATAPGGRITGLNLSIWREGAIPWRQGNRDYNGVFLGWNRAKASPTASYTITLPDGAANTWRLDSASTLELSIAALDENAPLLPKKKAGKATGKNSAEDMNQLRVSPDFTLELVATDGATAACVVSRFAAIPPPLKEQFTKLARWENIRYPKDWEPVFQTVSVPLSAFPGIDPSKVGIVRLKFDRTVANVICLSRLGFSHPAPP